MSSPYDESCLNKLRDLLIAGRSTVSVAESVTSGHLQAALSSADNAMRFFQGGITAYNAGQKTRHLMVEPIYALEENCVSREVAAQMSLASNLLFISEYGIGITGYASPQPAEGVDDLFAFAAIARGKDVIRIERLTTDEREPLAVQVHYTNQVLRMLLQVLDGSGR